MSNVAVVGAQWGDEGKGKIVLAGIHIDAITAESDHIGDLLDVAGGFLHGDDVVVSSDFLQGLG